MNKYSLSIKQYFNIRPKSIEGFYIIGNCDNLIQTTIRSNTNQVVISEVTIDKNIKHHSDLTIEDYQVLDNILLNYGLLVKDGDKTAGIIYAKEQQYYYALKSTKSGDTIFLTSFRKTNVHDIKRIRNKSKKGLVNIIVDKED